MRVSTNQSQQVAINAMLEQQEKLGKVQQQVATGKRIFRPSDDPVTAAKIVNLKDIIDTNKQHQDNIDAARARLSLEEGILGNVTDVLQRVRELTVMANNDIQTSETRTYIAEEIEQRLEELLSLANSTDSTGEFLFAGTRNQFKPFTRDVEDGFDYHGDDGQRYLLIGPRRQIATSDSGTDVFRNIKDGNGYFITLDNENNKGSGIIDPGRVSGDFQQGTYAIIFEKIVGPDLVENLTYKVIDDKGAPIIPAGTPYKSGTDIEFEGISTFIKGEPEEGDFFVIRPSMNQDVFTTLDRLVDALRNVGGSSAETANLHNQVNRTLIGMDQGLNNILAVRANIGARLNALDSQEKINEAYNLHIREILSDAEDLDYAEAVSELNMKLSGLEASQKAFTRVQGISLFNHL